MTAAGAGLIASSLCLAISGIVALFMICDDKSFSRPEVTHPDGFEGGEGGPGQTDRQEPLIGKPILPPDPQGHFWAPSAREPFRLIRKKTSPLPENRSVPSAAQRRAE